MQSYHYIFSIHTSHSDLKCLITFGNAKMSKMQLGDSLHTLFKNESITDINYPEGLTHILDYMW